MTLTGWVLIAGSLVVLVLACYALWLTREVRLQQRRQEARLNELEQEAQRHREGINRSIQVIAQGLMEDQLSLTEAAIRIRGLLDALSVSESVREEFSAFYLLADSTRHIPILDAWKALKTKDKLVFDRQRMQLESDHKEFVLDAAQRIRGRHF